jgi:hypothetical protein
MKVGLTPLQFQADGMVGAGPFAGAGVSLGMNHETTPPIGYSVNIDKHSEINVAEGLDLGLSHEGDLAEPSNGQMSVPEKAIKDLGKSLKKGKLPKIGVGGGAMVGYGLAQTVTFRSPPLKLNPTIDRNAETPPVTNVNAPSEIACNCKIH